MRSGFLALSATLVLFAAGCGDDTTTTTPADFSVKADMAAAQADMTSALLNCSGLFSCISGCLQGGQTCGGNSDCASGTCTSGKCAAGAAQACANTCGARAKTSSITLFNNLVTCLNNACAADAGNRTACLQAAIGTGGACVSDSDACTNEK
jgi:hypothetical protein